VWFLADTLQQYQGHYHQEVTDTQMAAKWNLFRREVTSAG